MRIPHLALAFASCLALAACASSEERLRAELDAANRCETAEDCVLIGGKCPFDCYVYVHKDEAAAMKPKLDAFRSSCEYGCVEHGGVECVRNKCKPITEVVLDAAGNVGERCETHADCVTPTDYLVRSSCPFASRCIKNHCAVVCPMVTEKQDPETGLLVPLSCENDAACDCSSYAANDMVRCACVDNACVAIVKE